MTRNHFSRRGGPYFINNGFSAHSPEPSKPSKPAIKVLYTGVIVIGWIVALIGVFVYSL